MVLKKLTDIFFSFDDRDFLVGLSVRSSQGDIELYSSLSLVLVDSAKHKSMLVR
jgi:hypothetical protein